jgi:glycine/D-amino acid oxidase-like deaminating enzyme
MPRVLAAYGYGGNGITFSFMAALMIGAMIADTRRNWFDDFALDREAPGFGSYNEASAFRASGASF